MSADLKLASYEEMLAEIAALPEGVTGEIMGPGELRTMSRPGSLHRGSALRLTIGLASDNLQSGGTGWWIEVEAEIELPNSRLYVPDLSGWRVGEEPNFIHDNPIRVVPDWVCEILSRDTQRADRTRKLPNYMAAGVSHAWIVDPAAQSIEVYVSLDGRPLMIATATDEPDVLLPPFDHPMDVGGLWKAGRRH